MRAPSAPAQRPYRLRPAARQPARRPVLDASQAAVAAHRDGPLLVLAGPGTGKTTTLVESVAALVEDRHRPVPAERVLVLTFSRRAALELRERITARVGRATGSPVAWTFHSFCLALLTQYRSAESPSEDATPPRLLSGPEQDAAVFELLEGGRAGEGEVRWPDRLQAALGTRGLAD